MTQPEVKRAGAQAGLVLSRRDAAQLERYRIGGPSLDLDGLETDLARALERAMREANGGSRDAALEALLQSLPKEDADTIRTQMFAVDLNAAPPGSNGLAPHPNGARHGDRSDISDQRAPSWPSPPSQEAFHGLAGGLVAAVDPHTEADRAAVLVHILLTYGIAVGRGPHVMVGATRHGTNECAVIVGKSAKARKGDSKVAALAPFVRIDPKIVAANIRSGLTTGQGMVYEVRDPRFANQHNGDGEDEEVCVDPGVEDKRRLFLEPELARILRLGGQHGNILLTSIRQAFDGETLAELTRRDPITATEAHIGIMAHVTQAELQAEFRRTDKLNGLGNRFLWFLVRRSKLLPDPPPVEGATFEGVAQDLRRAIAWGQSRERMTRDSAARDLWAEMYGQLGQDREDEYGMVADALLARGEAHVLRLSLIYTLLDGDTQIRCEHLEAAKALWDYCERSVIHIFGDCLSNPLAEKIRSALARHGEMDRTAIRDLFTRHAKSDQIDHALSTLRSRGIASCVVQSTGGAPREVWALVP